MAELSLAVIVVNYNGATVLPALAASLQGLRRPPRHFVLVDNASTDGSDQQLETLFPGARVLRNSVNRGLAAAINQALREVLPLRPEHLLLLNPDTSFGPDLLDRIAEAGDARTLVVPRVLTPDGRLAGHAGRFDLRRGLLLDTHDGEPADSEAALRTRELETGSFSCLLAPRQAFEATGLIDESLGMYYEDTDFCLRCRRAGFRIVYQPAAVLHHAEGGASGGRESPFAVYYTTRNRPRVVRRHAPTGTYAVFLVYFLLTRLLRAGDYALGGRRRHARALLLGLRDWALGRTGMTRTPSDL